MTKLLTFCTQMCRALSKRNCLSANSDNAVLASTSWTPWPTSRGKRSREPPWMRFVGPELVVVIWQIFSGGRLHNCWQGRPDRSSLSWDHKNGKLSRNTRISLLLNRYSRLSSDFGFLPCLRCQHTLYSNIIFFRSRATCSERCLRVTTRTLTQRRTIQPSRPLGPTLLWVTQLSNNCLISNSRNNCVE